MLSLDVTPRAQLNDDQQIQYELWFQPVYHLPSGRVMHNEVLLRGRDQQGRLLLPKELFPHSTTHEQSQHLDLLVVERTLLYLKQTKSNIPLTINLSRSSLYNSDFIHQIDILIRKFQVNPARLGFELSEVDVAAEYQTTCSFIRQLKSLGIQIVLDNFANQYLTLIQLEKLDVDVIKLDSCLIQSLSHGCLSTSLLDALVELSSRHHQLLVATSVDNLAIADQLQELKLDYVQGYCFKAPSQRAGLTTKINLLGMGIDSLPIEELLATLDQGIVFTPNVDHIMKLQHDAHFLQAYHSADYKVCDSQILFYASKFLGMPIQEKISGSDLFPAFYQYHRQNEHIKIFLLGAAKGVAQRAQAKINQKVGREIIVDTYSPSYGFDKNEAECAEIIERIRNSGATVLAIGVGAPKQERWIYKYKDQLPNIKIFLAIGATIDFEAGQIRRAPKVVSHLGLEWLFRLVAEPQRLWKRYLIDDLPFVWLVLQRKLKVQSSGAVAETPVLLKRSVSKA